MFSFYEGSELITLTWSFKIYISILLSLIDENSEFKKSSYKE